MNIGEMAGKLLKEKLGTSADLSTITDAFSTLLGGDGGKIDISGLVSKLMGSGDALRGLVGTWLGDGANGGMSASQLMEALGKDKVGEFAKKVGVETSQAASGLSDVLPKLIDQFSKSGSLLDSAGGLGGLMNKAKKFF